MSSSEPQFKALTTDFFKFRCHKDIACFTQCCAKLKLMLTPFDILRLKKRLGLDSDTFLDQYTDTAFEAPQRFPMIYLKMNQEAGGKCPFVTPDGCTLYQDRPGACRIYPLGRAAMQVDTEKDVRQKFFLVQEEHCLGFREEKEWSVAEWMAGEGVDEYNTMNDQWMQIITSKRDLGSGPELQRKIQMFFMASYNLDKFRDFVFKSRFFERFDVAESKKAELRDKDEALLLFAVDWLHFSLFGEKTMKLKS